MEKEEKEKEKRGGIGGESRRDEEKEKRGGVGERERRWRRRRCPWWWKRY